MRINWQIAALAIAFSLMGSTSSSWVAPQHDENPDLPRGHWAYEVLDVTLRIGLLQPAEQSSERPRLLTRYEAAVATARILDRCPELLVKGVTIESKAQGGGLRLKDVMPAGGRQHLLQGRSDPMRFITAAEVTDAIAAMQIEFAYELARLGMRFG